MSSVWDHLVDVNTGYMDLFGDDYHFKEPLILEDGTSVLFPRGWTDEDADKWRKGMHLQRPLGCPTKIYGPH